MATRRASWGPMRWVSSPRGSRFVRFGLASVGSTLLGVVLLALGYKVFGWPAFFANLFSVVVGTGPLYWISKRWIWRVTSDGSEVRRAVSFWVTVLVGWLASSVAVTWASHVAHAHHATRGTTTDIIVLASICAYGAVAVGRFLIFDHLVFRGGHAFVPEETMASSGRGGTRERL